MLRLFTRLGSVSAFFAPKLTISSSSRVLVGLRTIVMYQTKIGEFFKKSVTTVAAAGDGVEEPAKKKSNNNDAFEVNGRKRKSKVSSSEEEDVDARQTKKNCLKVKLSLAKKPRSRIVVASSSDDEEPQPEKDTKPEKKVKTPPKKVKGSESKEKKVFTSSEDEEETKTKNTKKATPPKTATEEEPIKDNKKKRINSTSEEEPEEDEKSKKKTTPPKNMTKEEQKKKKSPSSEEKAKKETKAKKNGTSKKEEPKKRKVSSSEDEESNSKEATKANGKTKIPEKSTKAVVDSSPVKTGGMMKLMMGGGAKPKGWNADYDPSKAKYSPITDATWNRGEKVPYLALAKTLEIIEATSSRLKFIEILANYFRSVIVLSPDDLLFSVYLCLNKLAPAYEGIELGVAETNVMKAIAQATGRALDKIKTDAGQLGDLGLVAERSRSNQKTLFQPEPLTVSGVFHKLKEIAAMTGQASHSKKISMITSMLVACKYSEARYLTRSLLGKLRIGLAEQSLLQALAQATYLTPPDQDMSEWPPKILNTGAKMSADSLKAAIDQHAFTVKSCFCECPNYDILIKALLEVGIEGLEERCSLTPGIPPRPMLAQPTKGVADVLQRFEGIRFTCEYKYDGERAQIHLSDDGTINIYSRNQENNTSKYPDIISRFNSCIKGEVKSCIIDTEAVAWDLEKGGILPFQVLSTRKRKDANEAEIKVQVCIFAFDLIYLNGTSLVKEPLIKRREILHEHFQVVEGQFLFATSVDTDSMEVVQEFLEESIKGNCEGLMVKTLDERATYELAKRSQKWLKLKKDYLESGGDSLDLVVIGGFLGKGKRTGTYGGFLLACYDPDEEAFQTICKIGTGFSDEQLQQHTESLRPNIIPHPKSYYRFNHQLTPDHWFDAVQVWEVKCADLSLSPVHTAGEGLVDEERGISLRFPRFLRIRDDKNVEDATSSRQVADMYKNQEQVKNTSDRAGIADDDEFY